MSAANPIHLRAWQEADLPLLTSIRNDVPLQAQLLARVRGSTTDQVRRWLEERSTGPDSLLFIIADSGSDAALGYLQLVNLDATDLRGDFGICVSNTAQGRGVGAAALAALIDHAREKRRLRKICLRVRADNLRAIRCYLNAGFIQCGVLREHCLFEGVWHDVMLMDLFL
jgi:diamine N-acetyltransferase